MSQAIPCYSACDSDCTPETTLVPGPAGADGADGAAGTNGVNAYTTLTAQFTMPAELATGVATVASNVWMAYGQIVAIGDPGAGTPYAYLRVTTKTGSTQVTLQNLEDAGSDAYADNVAPATVFPVGTIVSPGGLQGPVGATGAAGGGAPDDLTYWVSAPSGDLSAEVDLSALSAGFLKVSGGVPSTVADVPLANIDTGAATIAQVLKPDGAGSATAGQVQDDEIAYGETAIAALDIDWSLDRNFYKALTADSTFTFSNMVAGKSIKVTLQQDAGVARAVTWPTVLWTGGAAPVMTTTLGAYAEFVFSRRGSITLGSVSNDKY